MTAPTTVRRLGVGLYETLDGRYRIERQDGETECSHPLCDQFHRRFWTETGDGRGAIHWMAYVAWHVWDTVADDYAGGGGPVEHDTKRDALRWLMHHLAVRARSEGSS